MGFCWISSCSTSKFRAQIISFQIGARKILENIPERLLASQFSTFFEFKHQPTLNPSINHCLQRKFPSVIHTQRAHKTFFPSKSVKITKNRNWTQNCQKFHSNRYQRERKRGSTHFGHQNDKFLSYFKHVHLCTM